MEAEARRKTFSQDLETLRRQGIRPDPSEIARLGLKSGLTPREILLEIQDFLEYRHTRSGEIIDALALFITSHCEQSKAKRVLEYAAASGYCTGTWGTYRQWAEAGAQVRKGEKSAFVVFYKEGLRIGVGEQTISDFDPRVIAT